MSATSLGPRTGVDRMLIRYRVKPAELEHNVRLVRAVYAELEATQPKGLRYATFQLEDQMTFVDVALGPDLPGPLPQLESFRRFRLDHEQRCDERMATEFTEVGSFRMWE